MAYFAKDLSPEQRLAIESLLGRRMSEKEAIAIRAYEPAALSPERSSRSCCRVGGIFCGVGCCPRSRPLALEADAIFEEAMRQTPPESIGPTGEDVSRTPARSAFESFLQIRQGFFLGFTLAGDIHFEALGNVPVSFTPARRKGALHGPILRH